MTAASADERPEFVTAAIEARIDATSKHPTDASPLIDFDLDGAGVWVCLEADAGMVVVTVRTLKVPK